MIGERMTTSREALNAALVEEGYWLASGVPGIFGFTRRFESILEGFESIVIGLALRAGAEQVDFPPVVPRELMRRTGYMESFADLCGSVHSYDADRGAHLDLVDRVEAGGDWSEFLAPTELTLCPAACYPLYPTLAGELPEAGRSFDLQSYVFRNEPSDDPARLQSFRVRETIQLGRAETVLEWRDARSNEALELLRSLGLDAKEEVASDPFFGRAARMMASTQIAERAKLELVVPITSTEQPTSLCSFNAHRDKFAKLYEIFMPDGEHAHSACLGYGLERVGVALLATHGFDVAAWPKEARDKLGL